MPRNIVSVLIDTYNHERYIEQAVVSVLEQDFPPEETEILVVDDGSTDRTPEIVRKFEPRVRLLRKSNGGQASAFNAAIPETSGALVAFLDGDDWWTKDKLSAVAEAFEANPRIPAVGHGFYEVYENEPRILMVPQKACRIGLSNQEEARISTVAKSFVATSKLTVRRSVLERVGQIPNELVFCADEPILNGALALGGAFLLDRPLCYYRYHSSNLFGFHSLDPAPARKKYQVQVCITEYLPKLLAGFGIGPETIEILIQRHKVDMYRFEALYEGGRWEVFQAEARAFRQEFKNPSVGYLFFKAAIAGLALLLPPSRFYQMRDWYGKKGLSRFREVVGTVELTYPEMYRRVPLSGPD
jgi:glycosyltransferase involved in cell wall biosynthesis